MAERNAETNRRCVFTPYGVHVINVTRSSPGTIFNFDVSSGLIFGDAIHLVAKRMAHHIDIEVIANPHLIQTRKH